MEQMSAMRYGQKANKYCNQCGKSIVYGVNGAQISDYCTDCKPITYHRKPTPVRNVDWDELDAMEDRCVKENENG